MVELLSDNEAAVLILVIAGFASFLVGQALAVTWRPYWQTLLYACLLGGADRFLIFALYDGQLLSIAGYAIDTLLLIAIGSLAFRVTRARKMVTQYPWLYEPAGPLSWREKPGGD